MIFMEKKKGFSLIKVLITVICFVFIIISLLVNIGYSGGKTPCVFGRYIYIVKEGEDIGGGVTEGAALIAKKVENETIIPKDIVLCYPSDAPDRLSVRSIYSIVNDENNAEKYYTATSVSHSTSTDEAIGREKIVAICTGYPMNSLLGAFISFTKSASGIIAELVIPSIILVIFLIIKIASAKTEDDEDEDEFGFYEYDEEEKAKAAKKVSHEKSDNPLFENFQEIQPSDELERKKMSIVKNFSQKKVNHDSPYQKEKERTMQFKAQRSAELSFAAKNVAGASSTAPTADALREEMLRKTAEAERTGSFSIKNGKPVESASDITGVLPKAQLAEMSRNNVPKTTPLRSQSAQPGTAPKKNSSPDISDIINKTDAEQKKKLAADMSVDDLIKLIDSEKKRL